jgi:hypothetical protein
MPVASPVALRETPAARVVSAPTNLRLGLLFAVLLLTAASSLVLSAMSALKPIGQSDLSPDYAAIAPMRDYIWTFFIVAGIQLIVGACAAAVAGWVLTPARGARWATVGGSLIWLGAALYGVGIGGWAALYYFGSDAAVLGPATAARIIDHANDDTARMLAIPIAGALLIAIGTLILAVALWRAGTVPRWVPVVGALSAVATVMLPPSGIPGLVGETASSATTVALGLYAWRRGAGLSRHSDVATTSATERA